MAVGLQQQAEGCNALLGSLRCMGLQQAEACNALLGSLRLQAHLGLDPGLAPAQQAPGANTGPQDLALSSRPAAAAQAQAAAAGTTPAAPSASRFTDATGRAYPTLYVVNQHIADADFPRVYKAADAFVLPSRGEGWGR
jgi:glycosyltransferase involved in cell wall biosynthesis